ncbi:MAG: exopolysaccharide biosynthesis WecB/TagA/CpsF family protein [Arenicella sp.]|jgi:exopolysaccharide biosynthesis WecB/TagA/CpsF family protein
MRVLIGTTMLLLVLPKVGLQCLLAWYHQKKITLYVQQYAGKNMQRLQHRTVTVANTALSDIDTWFLYLKGAYDLIGPHPIEFEAASKLDRDKRARLNIAPGIISPFQIKRVSGIAHQDENQLACDFANTATDLRRVQIFAIWFLQRLMNSAPRGLYAPVRFKLLGVTLANLSMREAVNRVIKSLNRTPILGDATRFAFVNADCANKYCRDPSYKQTLNQFDTVFADGIGVKIAARWQGIAVAENVNGTDMFPLLCDELAASEKSVYLLGASNSVVNKVAAKLKIEYPSLKVAGYSDGFSHHTNPEKLHGLINQSGAELLLVALGAPRQERWIANNAPYLRINAVIGVGGLFDFYSEEVSRAPVWLRELSLEWIWRLAAQPLDKGARYLVGNPLFLLRAARASRNSKVIGSEIKELSNDQL